MIGLLKWTPVTKVSNKGIKMSGSKITFLKDNLETETESVFQEEIKKPKRVSGRNRKDKII